MFNITISEEMIEEAVEQAKARIVDDLSGLMYEVYLNDNTLYDNLVKTLLPKVRKKFKEKEIIDEVAEQAVEKWLNRGG